MDKEEDLPQILQKLKNKKTILWTDVYQNQFVNLGE